MLERPHYPVIRFDDNGVIVEEDLAVIFNALNDDEETSGCNIKFS